MAVIAVIPARFGSTRFPGKPLSRILDRSMIQRVHEQASRALRVERVIVATDDERIKTEVESFRGECLMTSPQCKSGTDRLAEVALQLGGLDDDIYVNVQGDEPLIEPSIIDAAIELVESRRYRMATLATRIHSSEELHDEGVVKVLVDRFGGAIYFSRLPIPHSRGFNGGDFVAYRHLGLYVYRKSALMEFSSWSPAAAEERESLEQLRALENGLRIGVAIVDSSSIGVDRPEDLQKVIQILENGGKVRVCTKGT